MVRPYISAEFERDYDLTWDLDLQRQIEAEYLSFVRVGQNLDFSWAETTQIRKIIPK